MITAVVCVSRGAAQSLGILRIPGILWGRYWIAAGFAGRDANGRASAEPGGLPRRAGRGGGAECESIAKSTASAGNAQIGLIFQWTACR